jgi:DGQHR domain-containing protein
MKVPALRVRQWLAEWDDIAFDPAHHRAEPEHWFLLFSLSAGQLRALSGISRRKVGERRRADELGIQREHDPTRSAEISRFVRHGFPWSTMAARQRESGRYDDLKKPGWLPTALVVNILTPGDERRSAKLDPKDALSVGGESGADTFVELPEGFGPTWTPGGLRPIEVIDGQHRLWAFDEDLDEEFELPVVAFVGLDISWQAYLFWTINIKPKKINASLAFDLYPLLRTEDWLTRFEGPAIYRETRAQELTEAMWAYPKSPWYQRVNMLGERGGPKTVTQASWIRSLTHSYLRPFAPRGRAAGGLFGAPLEGSSEPGNVLSWNRSQQTALLVYLWQQLEAQLETVRHEWALAIRADATDHEDESWGRDAALASQNSLLATDQGVRAFMEVTNDLIFINAPNLSLDDWSPASADVGDDLDQVDANARTLAKQPLGDFIRRLTASLATYDWRSYAASAQSEQERLLKASFRGTGGYKIFRRDLLRHIAGGNDEELATLANTLRLSDKEPT